MTTEQYCPTQSGTFTAYKPEYKTVGEWKAIPITTHYEPVNIVRGTPFPKQFGGIIKTINLSGYSQAQALMWRFSAMFEARGKKIKVRLVEYEVTFNIKARKRNN